MADDEIWDVTDIHGTPTGALHRRGDGPVPAGAFHIVASVCVVSSTGRVLVSLRAEGKDYPLAWEFPCLLSTSDAADELTRIAFGGSRAVEERPQERVYS
ncbi:hypothetical protein [Microbacterium testaceum]|uniref:hypothetical protein n=1 Tax=Microbacterium testaceum TaxID=2033 RepID=UPI000B18A86D|nr:hypothetical protein [Microbacterium testaceum]